jgi:hypothetical protein
MDNNCSEFIRESFKDRGIENDEILSYSLMPEFKEFFQLDIGHISEDKSVVIGKQGFIFVNDGSNRWRDQINGHYPDAEKIALNYAEILSNRSRHASALGKKYFHLIVPEKDIIYPELSPNANYSNINNKTIAKYLVDLADPAHLIYSINELKNLSSMGYLYHSRNSHFNFFGGYFIVKELLKKMGIEFPDLANIKYSMQIWPDDLSIKFVQNLNTSRRVLCNYGEENIISEPQGNVGKHIVFKNSAAPINSSVVVIGDSYSWNPDAGIARYLSLIFSRVEFLWQNFIDFKKLTELDCEILITESAERFLVRPPKDII